MSCYSPLKAIDFGLGQNGKHILKVIPANFDLQNSLYKGAKIIPIPCGQCLGCRLDYSKIWAERCMMEACLHNQSWFVTLTYDDEHLPSKYVNTETGEISRFYSLSRRDVQLFIKRLRKNTGQKISYFGSGEYGEKNFRPHYHLILFGLELNDLEELYRDSRRDFIYYNSHTISDNWKNGKYECQVVTKVTYETCAYTARYIMKKQKGINRVFYEENILVPEFSMMSTRPAIGKRYYEIYKDKMFMADKFSLNVGEKGLLIKPPRYFEKLYEIEENESYIALKNKRTKRLENSMKIKHLGTTNSYKDMLLYEQEHKQKQIKSLTRKEV